MPNQQKQNLFLGLLTLVIGFYLALKSLVVQKIVVFFPWPLGFYENIKNPIVINGVVVLTLLWTIITCYLLLKFEKYSKKYIAISLFSILLLHAQHSNYNQ